MDKEWCQAAHDTPNGSLNRLEKFLTNSDVNEAKEQIESLRIVQQLRSAGAVHGKETDYADALRRGRLDGLSLVSASMKVFEGTVRFVEWLQAKALNIKEDKPSPIEWRLSA